MATKEQKAKAKRRKAPAKPPAEEPQEESAGVNPAKEALGETIKEAAEKESVQPLPYEPRPFGSRIALPADGTLLRKDGEPVVYVMHQGQRRPFASVEAFTGCGFGWGDIVVLSPEEIEPIPVGEDVTGPSDL